MFINQDCLTAALRPDLGVASNIGLGWAEEFWGLIWVMVYFEQFYVAAQPASILNLLFWSLELLTSTQKQEAAAGEIRYENDHNREVTSLKRNLSTSFLCCLSAVCDTGKEGWNKKSDKHSWTPQC